MFVSNQQKLSLAMGILLGAMSSSATFSAESTSGVDLSGPQDSAPVAQIAMLQISQSSTGMRPMRIYDLPGSGATVAVIDTGLSEQRALGETPDGFLRLLTACDSQQPNSRALDVTGSVSEEAPEGPSLVVARAISVNSASSDQDAIRAIEWVISNKDQYHIRALDLAFSAPESSTRAGDPLNQAVMAAWKADIVVVSSANPEAF